MVLNQTDITSEERKPMVSIFEKSAFAALSCLCFAAALSAQEPNLATGFVWPVLQAPNIDPIRSIYDPRSPSVTCNQEKWYVDRNDFGNKFCPESIGCTGSNCFHPGEDWNMCPFPTNEAGTPVYSVANGVVVKSGAIRSDLTTGHFLVIKHLLPKAVDHQRYAYAGTTTTNQFSVLYSSYLHVDAPFVSVGDVVRKGDLLATISSCCSHLHFEMQITGSRIDYCDLGCGYCSSYQDLTDGGYIHPSKFIADHTNDISWGFVGGVANGIIRLEGEGAFGVSLGEVTAFTCSAQRMACIESDLQVRSWSESAIELSLYSSQFSYEDFDSPVRLVADRADDKTIDAVLVPFHDLRESNWYSSAVVGLWKDSVVEGRNSRFLWPEAEITRAEFVKILVRALNALCGSDNSCTQTPSFSDIEQGTWYFDSVVAAFNRSWLSPGSFFRPNDPINRAEVSALLSRALSLNDARGPNFADVADPAAWYYPAINAVAESGLMQGYPVGVRCNSDQAGESEARYFCPNRATNRAEAMAVLDRALKRFPHAVLR